MRQPVSAGERMMITLRYLASGETQKSLAYQFSQSEPGLQHYSRGVPSNLPSAETNLLKDAQHNRRMATNC
ncbi:hypothetical protein E2C01_040603 [Portunus trituberculatus]|uniref:Uncharacterized protein n=1 Tax=Portunus trituberculatus TaxID=210409 RepID=A0A5B7FP75_PORTR|nr:hypothetical protein [Portunus trituberculatus]